MSAGVTGMHVKSMGNKMNRRSILGAPVMTVLGLASLSRDAAAQDKSLKQQVVGAWLLGSVYDQTTDGVKHDVWGPGVQGALMISSSGRFSLLLMAGNREEASPNPRSPVGPAIAYFGTYTVDEGAKTLTYHIEASTFPEWNGTDRTATILSVSADELQSANAPVHDLTHGDIVPHFVWKRTKRHQAGLISQFRRIIFGDSK
jgi:Lipocalin-like domain